MDGALPKGIVLASGGMDSAVLCAFAARESRLCLLHVDYGQRTERRERECFLALSDHFGAEERLVVEAPCFRAIGGSALTDPSIAVPEGRLGAEGIPVTYVPFRNAHFIAMAVSWGEVIGATSVYVGAVEADSSGYPDCRPAFYRAMNEAVRLGTRPGSAIVIKAPFIGLKKKDLVLLGKSLGVPFERTWSCYREEGAACGRCDSCLLRLRAFDEAGVPDPLPYEERPSL